MLFEMLADTFTQRDRATRVRHAADTSIARWEIYSHDRDQKIVYGEYYDPETGAQDGYELARYNRDGDTWELACPPEWWAAPRLMFADAGRWARRH